MKADGRRIRVAKVHVWSESLVIALATLVPVLQSQETAKSTK
jgi:hypothetical protein